MTFRADPLGVLALEGEANEFAADLLIAPELLPHLACLTTTADMERHDLLRPRLTR